MQEEIHVKGEGFNFSIVPFSVSCDESLSIAARGVFIVLTRFMSLEDKQCYPSLNTLAKICNLSKPSLIKYLTELEKAGAITKEKRITPAGAPTSNLYTLNGYYKGVVKNFNYGSKEFLPGVVKNFNGGSKNSLPELYPINENHINDIKNTLPVSAAATAAVSVSDIPVKAAAPPKKKPAGYTAEFEAFWSAYPRKVDKAAAYKMWQRKLKNGAHAEKLITAAKNYALKVNGTEERYIKHGATFLNAIDENEYQTAAATGQHQHNADGSIGATDSAAQDAETQRLMEYYKNTKYWAEMQADEEARKNEDKRNIQLHTGSESQNSATGGGTTQCGLSDVEIPF